MTLFGLVNCLEIVRETRYQHITRDCDDLSDQMSCHIRYADFYYVGVFGAGSVSLPLRGQESN